MSSSRCAQPFTKRRTGSVRRRIPRWRAERRAGPRPGNPPAGSSPAQVSKSWTAFAPDAIWNDRTSPTTSLINSRSRRSVAGSRPAICLIAANDLDPPPSTRYDARVQGAPQKPRSRRPLRPRDAGARISPV